MEITIEQLVLVLGGIFSTILTAVIKFAWTKTVKSLDAVVESNSAIVTRMAVMENNMDMVSEARTEMKEITKDIITLQNQQNKSWTVQNKLDHRVDLLEEKCRAKWKD